LQLFLGSLAHSQSRESVAGRIEYLRWPAVTHVSCALQILHDVHIRLQLVANTVAPEAFADEGEAVAGKNFAVVANTVSGIVSSTVSPEAVADEGQALAGQNFADAAFVDEVRNTRASAIVQARRRGRGHTTADGGRNVGGGRRAPIHCWCRQPDGRRQLGIATG
jgi:hypothetical protein